MNIEIKKSIKPVKYDVAIKLLEERLLDINNNKKNDLIWILKHEETYTGGTSYKEEEILNKSIKLVKTNQAVKLLIMVLTINLLFCYRFKTKTKRY